MKTNFAIVAIWMAISHQLFYGKFSKGIKPQLYKFFQESTKDKPTQNISQPSSVRNGAAVLSHPENNITSEAANEPHSKEELSVDYNSTVASMLSHPANNITSEAANEPHGKEELSVDYNSTVASTNKRGIFSVEPLDEMTRPHLDEEKQPVIKNSTSLRGSSGALKEEHHPTDISSFTNTSDVAKIMHDVDSNLLNQKDSHEMAASRHSEEDLPIMEKSSSGEAPEGFEPVQHSLEHERNGPIIKNFTMTETPKAVQQLTEHSMELSRSPQQLEELPIDRNSTIASDIIKIWHDIDSKQICVALRQDARCPHPALLGRLSGPGLAILEWKKEAQFKGDDGRTVLCGGYDHYWLDAGSYFVQLIIIHCKDFGVNALTNDTVDAWMDTNHKSDCVEDANRNRIVEETATIEISAPIEGRGNYQLGRWVRKNGLPSRPLPLRYQPLTCPRGVDCDSIIYRDTEGVKEGKDVTGLYEYEFQWNMPVSEDALIEKLRQRIGPNRPTTPIICVAGDSHSQYMWQKSLPALNLSGLFHEHIAHVWPDPDGIVAKIETLGPSCEVFFVQVGQWPPSSNTGGKPFPFRKYYDKVKQLVQNILVYKPNATVYLATIDQAPLMNRINQCRDWRTPTYMDTFSYLNQQIIRELNTDHARYIDTNFIINTHWDGNPDWNHLLEISRSRKTLYAASVMLGETEWFNTTNTN